MGESSLDLRGLLKSWMITLRARGKSAETLRAYRIAAELFCEHSDVLTKDAVISWLAGMDGVEPATIRLRLAGVKQFCHWLGQEGYLDPSPILLVKAPTLTQKPVDNLSDERSSGCSGRAPASIGATSAIAQSLSCWPRPVCAVASCWRSTSPTLTSPAAS